MKDRIKSKSKWINRFKSWCAALCHNDADTDPKKEPDTTFVVVQMFCYRSTPNIFQGQTQLDQGGHRIFQIYGKKTPPQGGPPTTLSSQKQTEKVGKKKWERQMIGEVEEDSKVSPRCNNPSLPVLASAQRNCKHVWRQTINWVPQTYFGCLFAVVYNKKKREKPLTISQDSACRL